MQNAGVSYAVDELARTAAENMQLSEENGGEGLQFSRSASSENVGTTTSENVDNYTEEQYNNFGWVRANDVLNKGEWEDFTSKFADAVSENIYAPQTKNGEYMIAVSDIYDALHYGTDNIIVYAKGSIESPNVSRVLEIAFNNTRDLDKRRRRVYDAGRRGIQPQAGGIFRLHNATDYGNRFYKRGESTQMRPNHGRFGVDRGAGGGGAAEAERGQVSTSVKPVSKTFTDVTGKERTVLGAGQGRYMVDGSIKNRNYIFDSPEAGGTIDATGKIHLANREEDETVSESGETVSGQVRRLASPKSVDNGVSEGYNDSEYMMRRGWARGVLSQEDRALLERKISEAKNLGFKAHPRLSDGSYLFEINNKIVVVSGDFENPIYDGIVDINADNADTFNEMRKEIEDATYGKRYSRSAFLEIIEGYYGEEVLRVYRRENWVGSSSNSQGSYPTRPDGYKDFGYSAEQRYGDGSSRKVGSAVNTDLHLAPPSFAPVRKEYVDITGNTRYVLEYAKGEYGAWGSYSPRPHNLHPSIEAAIEAENNSLLRPWRAGITVHLLGLRRV